MLLHQSRRGNEDGTKLAQIPRLVSFVPKLCRVRGAKFPPRTGNELRSLFRREDYHDPPALHLWVLLEFGDRFQFLSEPLDEFEAFVDVGVFAAAEDDREDDLVFFRQELLGPIDLGHEVVVANLGAQPELLVLAVMRVAFVLPLLLLVLELAVVHDPANGRFFLGRNFDKVQAGFAGTRERLDGFQNAEHFAFRSDDADR